MRVCSFAIIATSMLAGGPAYGQPLFDYGAVDVPCAAGAPTFCHRWIAGNRGQRHQRRRRHRRHVH